MELNAFYSELRVLHIGCAIVSFALFALRGFWMLAAPALLARRWVRVLPHLIDTMLLASAIALTLVIQQYPFVSSWLTAKFFGLVAYILLGTIALKRGPTRAIRSAALVGAIAVFLYIAAVARAHRAAPWQAMGTAATGLFAGR